MKKIIFIGLGNMAGAILDSMLKTNKYQLDTIHAIVNTQESKKRIEKKYNITSSTDFQLKNDAIIIIAIKPQQFIGLFEKHRNQFNDTQCFISIMAGIEIASIKKYVNNAQIIRTMPNIPAAIGEGMSLYFGDETVSTESFQLCQSILDCSGKSLQASNEEELDLMTIVSGCGPGYIFHFADAMLKGAIKLGIDLEKAKILVHQTLIGTAKMIQSSPLSTEELTQSVCSKGGLTQAAISKFDESGLHEIIYQGMKKAYLQNNNLK